MKTAILVDQRNFCSSLHFRNYRGYYVLKGEPNSIQILKKLFFPPFITFVVACLMNVFNFDFQEWIQFILQKVGGSYSFSISFSWSSIAF
jgi:predicted permease